VSDHRGTKLSEANGDIERFVQSISKRFKEDAKWVNEAGRELDAYMNQWVAVVNKRVVASGDDVDAALAGATAATGLPARDIVLFQVDDPRDIYVRC